MKLLDLQKALDRLDRQGRWLVTRNQFRILFPDESEHAQRESLARHVRNGSLVRVAYQLYANPMARSRGPRPLEAIVPYLRPLDLNYISTETALSERGVISQMTQSYLTVMTTGPSHLYETPYGTIEFTHTKRDPAQIRDQLVFDKSRGLYVATLERAVSDLRRIGRNVGMIDEEELGEQLSGGP